MKRSRPVIVASLACGGVAAIGFTVALASVRHDARVPTADEVVRSTLGQTAGVPASSSLSRVNAVPAHEAAFFEALNHHPQQREASLASLRAHVAQVHDDARAALLLGVGHLWVAAENPPDRATAFEHLVLARHFLQRAARLNPTDDRIPSWLLSAEISLAQAEGRTEDAVAALGQLRTHAERDPCFHSVAFAINVWEWPRDSDELARAQRLLEAAAACATDDPSVRNMERWPHNVEGFLVGLSDVALKRGDRNRALAALVTIEAWPGADSWPHRREADQRRRDFDARAARFGDDDPSNDPAFLFERGGPVSCVSCHQAAATPRSKQVKPLLPTSDITDGAKQPTASGQ
jgi:hypothetical protein